MKMNLLQCLFSSKTTEFLAACAILMVAAFTAQAQSQVISLGDPVSGAYYNNDLGGSGEVFPASNITDGLGGDTGSANNWSFWLAPQGQLGTAVINLQGSDVITGFNIQDTHNRQYDDRGTQGFTIAVSSDDVHFTTVLTGAFTQSQWLDLTTVNFTLPTPVIGQYVEFNVDSMWGGEGGGLNELDVLGQFDPPPDPAPDYGNVAFLLMGLIPLGVAHRLRRAV